MKVQAPRLILINFISGRIIASLKRKKITSFVISAALAPMTPYLKVKRAISPINGKNMKPSYFVNCLALPDASIIDVNIKLKLVNTTAVKVKIANS